MHSLSAVRITARGGTALLGRGAAAWHRYHSSPAARLPYKDDQDRGSLKPRAQEYSKADNDAAHTDAAFNPDKTRPETEKKSGGDALENSPANQDLSQAKTQENKASGQQKKKPSGGGGGR